MQLLVSVINTHEARQCVQGGTDIIDVKNPLEGSLGGHSPRVIKNIRKIVPRRIALSAAIGDIKNKPGLVSQAALGVSLCNVNLIKIGLCDDFTVNNAVSLVKEVVNTVRDMGTQSKIVVCGYADAALKSLIRPEYIPDITRKAGADVAMIDTFEKKGGKGLFFYLDEKTVTGFSHKAHAYGLRVALAGKLGTDDIIKIKNMRCCDIIGIRSLACKDSNRKNNIESSRIKTIKNLIKNDLPH